MVQQRPWYHWLTIVQYKNLSSRLTVIHCHYSWFFLSWPFPITKCSFNVSQSQHISWTMQRMMRYIYDIHWIISQNKFLKICMTHTCTQFYNEYFTMKSRSHRSGFLCNLQVLGETLGLIVFRNPKDSSNVTTVSVHAVTSDKVCSDKLCCHPATLQTHMRSG
jgi:hypothetical protein